MKTMRPTIDMLIRLHGSLRMVRVMARCECLKAQATIRAMKVVSKITEQPKE